MTKTASFSLSGMHCQSCSLMIELTLQELVGVSQVQVSYKDNLATVTYDSSQLQQQAITQAIENLGYQVTPQPSTNQ